MLKISIHNGSQTPVLELSGRLVGPWVEELRAQYRALASDHPTFTLDLKEVSFVDTAGAQLLNQLHAQNIQFFHCSRFVEEQLRTAAENDHRRES